MLGVGAVATLTSAAILLGTFAYVALYALLYRITPVVLLWTGYHLLTDPRFRAGRPRQTSESVRPPASPAARRLTTPSARCSS